MNMMKEYVFNMNKPIIITIIFAVILGCIMYKYITFFISYDTNRENNPNESVDK